MEGSIGLGVSAFAATACDIVRWRLRERRGGTRLNWVILTTVVVRKASDFLRSINVVSLTSLLSQKDSRGMELALKYSSILGTSSNHRCWMLQPFSSSVILRCCVYVCVCVCVCVMKVKYNLYHRSSHTAVHSLHTVRAT